MTPEPPTIYLFAGCNGAGKTTFARAYLTTDYFKIPPRFLNADEIARGLSPLAPESVALKAGKLLLSDSQNSSQFPFAHPPPQHRCHHA